MADLAGQPANHQFRKRGRGLKFDKRNIEIGALDARLGDNSIRTSKYRVWNFFVLNLFEQFKKPANIYFLVGQCDPDTCLPAGDSSHLDLRRLANDCITIAFCDSRLDAQRLHGELQTGQR